MANSVPFRTTPQLGPQLDDVFTGLPYWDLGLAIGTPAMDSEPSYKLGNKEVGDDGHDYIWVQAGADIAASTQVVVDEDTWEVTAGSGGLYTPPVAVTEGQYFHVRKGAIDAP